MAFTKTIAPITVIGVLMELITKGLINVICGNWHIGDFFVSLRDRLVARETSDYLTEYADQIDDDDGPAMQYYHDVRRFLRQDPDRDPPDDFM